ncbi:hypothetical protein F5Y04DRAFT_286603 [Hypomontagnella monticulosa]|nr:hypothetical protein F5Y04DRAFT_286603 [Hypomontagnella monticulosa]
MPSPTATNTQSLESILSESKGFFSAVYDDVYSHITRDSDSSESLEPDDLDLGEGAILAIICGGILAIFIILGLVWLAIHIRGRRLGRGAKSPSFQPLKDMDTQDRSTEDLELGARG